MDLFPNGDEADLRRCDNVCIICREEMTMATVNKKLPCSHVFHLHCLRSWLERQQNCPICRTTVFPPTEPPAPTPAANGDAVDQPPERLQNVPALLQNLNNVDLAPGAEQPRDREQDRGEQAAVGGDEPTIQQQIPAPSDLPQGNQQPVPLQQRLPPQWNGQQLGVVWNCPNMLPITSMATFANGQFQYAGQQNPEPVINSNTQGMNRVPVVPMITPFSAPIQLLTPQGSTPEPHRVAAAAAVAAAAYSPYTGLVMMPPVTYIPRSGSTSGSPRPEDVSSSAAQAAAAASAASGVAAAFSQTQPFTSGEQQSMEATMDSIQKQLEFLQSQVTRNEGMNSHPETGEVDPETAGGPSTSGTQPETFAEQETTSANIPSLSTESQPSTSIRQPDDEGLSNDGNQSEPSTSELRARRIQRLERRQEQD